MAADTMATRLKTDAWESWGRIHAMPKAEQPLNSLKKTSLNWHFRFSVFQLTARKWCSAPDFIGHGEERLADFSAAHMGVMTRLRSA